MASIAENVGSVSFWVVKICCTSANVATYSVFQLSSSSAKVPLTDFRGLGLLSPRIEPARREAPTAA